MIEKLTERQLKKLSTYKDMAYRSLLFLYLHPNVGPEKLLDWLNEWKNWMEIERLAGKSRI